MNGVAWAVHQSSSRIERRKLVSITRSPSVAVVSEIAPFGVMAEQIANGHVGAAGVVQRRHDIRSDKTGATGHQQHSLTLPSIWEFSFAPVLRGRQLGSPTYQVTLPRSEEQLPTGSKQKHRQTSKISTEIQIM